MTETHHNIQINQTTELIFLVDQLCNNPKNFDLLYYSQNK